MNANKLFLVFSEKKSISGKSGEFAKESILRLQFAKHESVISIHSVFHIKFNCDSHSRNNIHIWYEKFEATGSICKGERPRRQSQEKVQMYEMF